MRPRLKLPGALGLILLATGTGLGVPPGDSIPFEPIVTDVGRSPRDSALVDLNGDGTLDAALADGPFNQISVLLGNSDGTFAVAGSYSFVTAVAGVAAADIDGDGALDIIGTRQSLDLVGVLKGNGDGTFQPASFRSAGDGPRAIATGDFSGDGIDDVLVANEFSNDVSFFRGSGSGLLPEVRLATGTRPVAIAAADVNGDGALDAAVLLKTAKQVVVLMGNGAGSFPASYTVPLAGDPSDLALGRIDADSLVDLVVDYYCGDQFCLTSGTVAMFRGLGDGTFQAGPTFLPGKRAESLGLSDLNGDGRLDVAVDTQQDVAILLGAGDGSFALADRVLAGSAPDSVALGDVDADGHVDLTVVGGGAGTFIAIRGRGDGTFLYPAQFSTAPDAQQIAMGDVDLDGVLDLVVASADSTSGSGVEASLLLGRGDGTFDPEVKIHTGGGPLAAVVADFNEDGRPDVATANATNSGDVSIVLGHGDGTFAPEARLPAGTTPRDIAAEDL
ncbi:MAG TPA: VCBS repeat-containing protein, partial [Candidatus Cryosericum sp.]|nr:VCBS repeat-containing protein [Candidatus Cryosericum sp.]